MIGLLCQSEQQELYLSIYAANQHRRICDLPIVENHGGNSMNYRDAAQRLEMLSCHELPRRGGGSHRKWHNPSTRQMTVLPNWGSRDLRLGTLRCAIRQLGLDWKIFNTTWITRSVDEKC